MGYIKWCVLISALVAVSEQSNDYRLPDGYKPFHYKLKIEPHIIASNFTFDGESEIFLEISIPTKSLMLHSLNLNIYEKSTKLIGEKGNFVPTEHIYSNILKALTLSFNVELQPGNYTLQLEYTGVMRDSPSGLFWNSYVDDDNETKYLVATHLTQLHAREVFPCWDEPALKATFDISIKHFPNYTALSNMPIKQKVDERIIDGKIWTEFETTPLMSTYLVAFTVSDFVNISNPEGNFSVWSRRNAIDSMKFGYELGLKAFRVLEEYTQIPYTLPKMDVIAIPTFIDGAMENWGLIIFKEDAFLHNSNSTISDKYAIAKFIVHEVSHQWFGNLVSPASWKDIWLSEGLSSYLHTLLTGKVTNDPRLMQYYLARLNFYLPEYDFGPSSVAIYQESNLDDNFVNLISEENMNIYLMLYEKTVLILHMLSNMLTEEVFHNGLRNMLQSKKFSTISTNEFCNFMQRALDESTLTHNFDVKKVMEPYIFRSGYPIVKVLRNYTTGTIKLTQECPGCKTDESDDSKSKFWIPINFATNTSLNFASTVATHWLSPNQKELIIEGIDPNDWIIFNVQGTGYYRVNYDEENWRKISDYLNSDKFSNIHVLNRERLLLEALNAWEEETLNENSVKDILSYLKREQDLIPWHMGRFFLLSYYDKNEELPGFRKNFMEFSMPLFEAFMKVLEVNKTNADDLLTSVMRENADTWSMENRNIAQFLHNGTFLYDE